MKLWKYTILFTIWCYIIIHFCLFAWKKNYFCYWGFAQLLIPTGVMIFFSRHQLLVTEIQTATLHTGLLLQVYIAEQVAEVNVTNDEEKSTSHASVFHKKARKRSSVSMPTYTQACNVTYQHTYSRYQRRNILRVARLGTWKLGKARINTVYTRASPSSCSAIQPESAFSVPVSFVQQIFTILACSQYLPTSPRLLPSHLNSLF